MAAAGIECLLADAYVSGVEGNIGAFPRRLLVAEEDRQHGEQVLAEAAGAVVNDDHT